MNKIKVLLVEDETSLAMILSDTLEAQGFEMRTAHDGEEGLRMFDEQIKAMAARYKVSEDEMKYKLKRKFDGYHFSPNMLVIFFIGLMLCNSLQS